MIRPVVVPRPSRFLAEQSVLRHGFGCQNPMLKLPCPLKLMKIFGPDVTEIFSQHAEQFDPADEHWFVRRVVGADAANIFVHDLLKTLKTMQRQDIARGDGPGDDLVAANLIGLEGSIDDFFQLLVFQFPDLRLLLAQIIHVLDRGLAGDPALGERA